MPRSGALLALLLTAAWAVIGCGTTTTVTVTQPATAAALSSASAPTTAPPAPQDTSTGTTEPATPRLKAVPRPRIIWDPIPFGAERKQQMVAYSRRHYGSFMAPTYRLIDPHVIVIHFTETPTFQATYNTFAPDTPDPELHELPNTCAHFVIDKSGGIHQLVPLGIMCRHTVGLNWTAIGIEHVGDSDREVLDDPAQARASIALVRWLRCRYHIAIKNVIGHNESLASPYHREDVPALRTQTHSDFDHADMQIYRHRLAAAGGCPPSPTVG
ncbi:MAG TPA: peptidoglycan recognition family protein [Solirubrobacteraceae bacterium]|nr:peptidoglycan recognition family protein [Solirubrobacteraceae bacterium]